jgi:hypothetical protein
MLDRDQSVDAPIAIRDRAISREFSMFTLTFSHDSETATQSFLCIDEFDIPVPQTRDACVPHSAIARRFVKNVAQHETLISQN